MTHDESQANLEYFPESGILRWREGNSHHTPSEQIIGYLIKGYRCFNFSGKRYRASRFIWFWMTGEWPNVIDHIDGNIINDRWVNLRNTTRLGNMQNLLVHRSGKLVGTSFDKRRNRWYAKREIKGKCVGLGSYLTEQEAHEAYVKSFTEVNHDGL